MPGNFREAFPDFPEADMPEIPAGFDDSSWRNDICPCFVHEGEGLVLWTDYADPAMSEAADFLDDKADYRRFILTKMARDGDGMWDDLNVSTLVATNDMQEVVAHSLAEAYATAVDSILTPSEWDQMRQRNRARPAGDDCCASHDFCDANMAMDKAFRSILRRSICLPVEAEEGECTEAQVEADCLLANAAWDVAKARHLTAPADARVVEDDGLTGSQRRAPLPWED